MKALDGRKIFSQEYISDLRKIEEGKRNSKTFIAQPGPQEEDLSSEVDILVTGGNRGGGKANADHEPILTPDGYVKMGDLNVGDKICTPYDGVQEVTEIFEQGQHNGYRVHFDDGTHVTCLGTHLFYARLNHNEEFREMTLKEILEKYAIDRPAGMAIRKNAPDRELAEIPLCGEVEMHEENTPYTLPWHPFLVGWIIATGTRDCTKGVYHLHKDYACLNKCKALGYNVFVSRKKGSDECMFARFDHNIRRQIFGRGKVRDSFIPDLYLHASIESRWELLKAIMTVSGGHAKKHPQLILPNKKFITQIAELARSLGIWVKQDTVNDDVEKMGWERLLMIAPNDKDLFEDQLHQQRSHNNCDKPKYGKNLEECLTKKITHIAKVKNKGSVKYNYRCITVSGKQHLYLTNGCTVNHNTFIILMEAMYDFINPHFSSLILRKGKNDFDNIIRDSKTLYGEYGTYNKSKDDMSWYFNAGGKLKFTYYDGDYEDFKDRLQGQQYAYIAVDEITQMEYEKFKYLLTSNRNANGIRNRFVGSCNPDPLSWVRQFIDYWIDENGDPIEERSGKVRYVYMEGDSIDEAVWGDTPHEVYMQVRDKIDALWQPEYEEMGFDKERMFVKSVTFIRADIKYNKKLLVSDPNYLAGLANQSEEQKARDLGGNWNFMAMGDDMIKMIHLQNCFDAPQHTENNVRYASCDVAFTGGDNCVLWLWIGHHLADLCVTKMDSMATCAIVKSKLEEWGVDEKNFVYDLNGLGQTFKGYFKRARPFNNLEAVQPRFKFTYDNVKSQCAYMLAEKMQRAEISFEHEVLERRFSGKGFDGKKLKDILQEERKCIRKDENKADKGWCLIKKEQMKKLCGHSPDFFEALVMRMIFDVGAGMPKIPNWVRTL